MAIAGAVAFYLLVHGTPKPRGHENVPTPVTEERFQRYHTQPPTQDTVAPIYMSTLAEEHFQQSLEH